MSGGVLTAFAKAGQVKIIRNDHRPEAEVNELTLVVGPELVCLRWGEADRARQELCRAFEGVGLTKEPGHAGIAKAF